MGQKHMRYFAYGYQETFHNHLGDASARAQFRHNHEKTLILRAGLGHNFEHGNPPCAGFMLRFGRVRQEGDASFLEECIGLC
jgi:hypothetical protein